MLKYYYFSQIKLRLAMCYLEDEAALDSGTSPTYPASSYLKLALTENQSLEMEMEPHTVVELRLTRPALALTLDTTFSTSFDLRPQTTEDLSTDTVFTIRRKGVSLYCSEEDIDEIIGMTNPWEHRKCSFEESARICWNRLQEVSCSVYSSFLYLFSYVPLFIFVIGSS